MAEDDDEDEEKKKPRRVIFAAGTKIHIDPLKGADVMAAVSRVALERERRQVEAQERAVRVQPPQGRHRASLPPRGAPSRGQEHLLLVSALCP